MNLEASLAPWTDWARQSVLQGSEYPLIDARELDMTRELTGAWTGDSDRAFELLENYLARTYGDVVARFVVFNFLFRLAHYEARLPEWAEEDKRPTALRCLRRFVGLQDVEELTDPKAVRWEIVNACAVADWDRTLRLYDQLKTAGSLAEAEFRALRGQFRVCLVQWQRQETRDEDDHPLA